MINLGHLPDRDNCDVLKTIAKLNIVNSDPFYVEVKPEEYCLNGFCFENVKEKIRRDGGDIVYGWQFREYDYMIEAMFHCIWKSADGKFMDVTPPDFPGSKSLFVIDDKGKDRTMPVDHCRLNTTENPFVDDMIGLDEAFFRFKNSGSRLNADYAYELSEDDLKIWYAFETLINDIEAFYYEGGKTNDKCYCNGGLYFEECHGNLLRQLVEFYK